MFKIEVPGKYVAGYISKSKDFKEYVNAIDGRTLRTIQIKNFNFKFPFYLIEFIPNYSVCGERRHFLDVGNKKELDSWVNSFIHQCVGTHKGDAIVYEIKEDFFLMEYAGKDKMGKLDHEHIGVCGNCFRAYSSGKFKFDDMCDCEEPTWS